MPKFVNNHVYGTVNRTLGRGILSIHGTFDVSPYTFMNYHQSFS